MLLSFDYFLVSTEMKSAGDLVIVRVTFMANSFGTCNYNHHASSFNTEQIKKQTKLFKWRSIEWGCAVNPGTIELGHIQAMLVMCHSHQRMIQQQKVLPRMNLSHSI